jgi:hypothetical protein
MSTEIQTTQQNAVARSEGEIIGKLVLNGDLSGLTDIERVRYYDMFCKSLGLNPVTKPFDLLKLNNKLVLYAKKDATEQLRKINVVSIDGLDHKMEKEIYIVVARGHDKTGRTDAATGAVSISGLRGDALANAIMKAETKAKRRLTLSICGLGIMDETEVESLAAAQKVEVTIGLGEPGPAPEPGTDPLPAAGPTDADLMKAIGAAAALISGDAVTAARASIENLKDMYKSKAIAFHTYKEKLTAMRDELEAQAAKKASPAAPAQRVDPQTGEIIEEEKELF